MNGYWQLGIGNSRSFAPVPKQYGSSAMTMAVTLKTPLENKHLTSRTALLLSHLVLHCTMIAKYTLTGLVLAPLN